MDLLDFDAQELYYDRPTSHEVAELLREAAANYGPEAEATLLRAAQLAPQDPSVLVALYRYYFYQHRIPDALNIALLAIEYTAAELDLPNSWLEWTPQQLEQAATRSMTQLRFLLMALKGAGLLQLRAGNHHAALAIFDKLRIVDSEDRLNIAPLAKLAAKS